MFTTGNKLTPSNSFRLRDKGSFRIGNRKNGKQLRTISSSFRRRNWTNFPHSVIGLIFSYCYNESQLRLVCKSWKFSFDRVYPKYNSIPTDLIPNVMVKRTQSLKNETNLSPSRWNATRGPSRSFTRKRANFLNRKESLTSTDSTKTVSSYLCNLLNNPGISESLIDKMEDIIMDRVEISTNLISKIHLENDYSLNFISLLNSCDMDDINERTTIFSIFFKIRYPQKTWDIWKYEDKDGYVYGWEDFIHLFILDKPPNHYIIEIYLSFSKSQLSLLNKKLILYHKKTGRKLRVIVYSTILDDSVIEIANNLEFSLQLKILE